MASVYSVRLNPKHSDQITGDETVSNVTETKPFTGHPSEILFAAISYACFLNGFC